MCAERPIRILPAAGLIVHAAVVLLRRNDLTIVRTMSPHFSLSNLHLPPSTSWLAAQTTLLL